MIVGCGSNAVFSPLQFIGPKLANFHLRKIRKVRILQKDINNMKSLKKVAINYS